jgi:hypothetical protein
MGLGKVQFFKQGGLTIMTAHRIVLLVFVWFGALLLSGCAGDMTPQTGAIARPDDRFDLVQGGVYDGDLNTNNLEMTYSIAESGTAYRLTGSLSFSESLTESFPIVQVFILKMSFLDGEGGVLKTIDISPSIDFDVMPGQIPVTASGTTPAGASAVAFNYFGQFRGRETAIGGDTWDISYFPYE